ncbi:hypothetical protein DYBT9275_04066 [Dyadobacter sp. CECT 9275]|uniref:Uncharacterized protein n=1 Tax=Dyadobacter helix TaxID=2822344 RepID=A0A916NCY7_9BACT|nr:hypothetical protein [Dyadobacter sp. CECT 9275]CAG5007530.1 hypothetical protein DYBT9275_04066 [Dyadobacter sp. CECT 9275]
MKVTTFGVKVWRWFSVLFLIGSLVWTYSVFPEMVAVDFSDTGLAELYVSKEQIFYVIMAIFLLNNIVIARLSKQIPKIDASHLPVPNRAIWAKHREELDEHISNWLFCLIAAINTITGFSLLALATVNSNQFKMDVFDFSWIFYVGLGLMVIIFLLPLLLFRTPLPKDKL